MQRRTFLTFGVVSAAVLLVAGGAAAWLEPDWQRGALSSVGREVFTAVGRAVLDQSLPTQRDAREIALNGLLGQVNALINALPPHTQRELSQLLSLLGSAVGRRTLAGLSTPWTQATVRDVQVALQGMRVSSLALRQQAYAALHDITAAAYFSDESNWPLLGYPGPLEI